MTTTLFIFERWLTEPSSLKKNWKRLPMDRNIINKQTEQQSQLRRWRWTDSTGGLHFHSLHKQRHLVEEEVEEVVWITSILANQICSSCLVQTAHLLSHRQLSDGGKKLLLVTNRLQHMKKCSNLLHLSRASFSTFSFIIMFSICGGSAATVWTGYIHTWRYSYSIVTLQGDPLAEIIFTFIFS